MSFYKEGTKIKEFYLILGILLLTNKHFEIKMPFSLENWVSDYGMDIIFEMCNNLRAVCFLFDEIVS